MAVKKAGPLRDDCLDMYARVTHAVDPNAFTKTELNKAVDAALTSIGRPKKIWPAALEFQLNGLLSGLGTPLANAASVMYKQIANPMIDLLESINPKSDKNFLDVVSGIQAALQGFSADLIYFRSGWANGYPLDIKISIKDTARRLNISEKDARQKFVDSLIEERVALAKSRAPELNEEEIRATFKKNFKPTDEEIETFVKESYDYMRGAIPGLAGEIVRVPTKISVAIDEYGKARFRRYKIAMLASRKARQDAGKDTTKYKELYEKYLKQSMEHVEFDEATVGKTWKDQAEAVKTSFYRMEEDLNKVFGEEISPYKTVKEYALREMFQQRLTGLPKKIQESRHEYPAAHLFIPFLKTPWNITKEGFTYVPGLPQVMNKYIFKPQYIKDKSGLDVLDPNKMGAFYEFTNEEMIARQLIGAGAFAMVMGMVQEGLVTGKPRDAAEAQSWKDAGIPQSSVNIGGTWVAYDRIEPLATVLGLSAELGRTWQELSELPDPDKDEKWATEIGKGTMFALKANMIQKSFIEGFNSFFNDASAMARSGDVTAGVSGVARQFIPAIINQTARLSDPYERQATTLGEKLMQRIPGARQQLPIDYGLTGGPRETSYSQALTSFNIQSAEQTPLQQYIYSLGVTKMREDKDLKSVKLNNEQLGRLRQLSNEFVTPRVERFVSTARFRNLPDARKKVQLERYIDRLKRVPRQRFYNELRKTDPKMAIKFKNEIYRKRGLTERMQSVE